MLVEKRLSDRDVRFSSWDSLFHLSSGDCPCFLCSDMCVIQKSWAPTSHWMPTSLKIVLKFCNLQHEIELELVKCKILHE